MRLRFTKMHGLGNDFVMIDAISQRVTITPERARQLADRHFGVGCDQVLVVETPDSADADFKYRIFNHDGSEVENCGNGARCFAVFVRQRGLTAKSIITVETAVGRMVLHVREDEQVTVDMGAPILNPADVPFTAPQQSTSYTLPTQGAGDITIGAVSMGNPHAVYCVNNCATAPVETLGPEIEAHNLFPKKVNAGFMQVVTPSEINLRVYERGAGETLACGTGACAAVVAGRLQGLLENTVKVNLPGGSLSITWEGVDSPVMMTGPATTVFHGQVKI